MFEIRGVLFPFGCFSNAELGCYTLTVQCVVGRQGATHGLVHHGEAVICERSIIHRSPSYEKAAAGLRSATAFRYAHSDRKVISEGARKQLISRYRLSRLACAANRYRLRFLTDRRRRLGRQRRAARTLASPMRPDRQVSGVVVAQLDCLYLEFSTEASSLHDPPPAA